MQDRFKQLGKSLRKDQEKSNLNARRIQKNFPLVERKLEILAGDHKFHMEFPVTNRKHTVLMNVKFKPDNCCECEPGATTVVRDATAYWIPESFGPSDGTAYPAIYEEPLEQTGTNFNYASQSPFFHRIYQEFPTIGGYTIGEKIVYEEPDPENPEAPLEFNTYAGVIIPIDGMYSVLFRTSFLYSSLEFDSYVKVSIRQNGQAISEKTYSVAKKNLVSVYPDAFSVYQYATCVPLHEDDAVAAYIETNIQGIVIDSGRTPETTTRFLLLGLGFGTLVGYVFDNDTGVMIEGATVSFTNGAGDTTTTNVEGFYEFLKMRPGLYSVTASRTGYTSMTRDIEVFFDDLSRIDFNLTTA